MIRRCALLHGHPTVDSPYDNAEAYYRWLWPSLVTHELDFLTRAA